MTGERKGGHARALLLRAVAATLIVALAGLASTSFNGGDGGPSKGAQTAAPVKSDPRGAKTGAGIDVRRPAGDAAAAAALRIAARVAARPAAAALQAGLGPDGVLDIDGSTGTVRILQKLDGTLTEPSTKAADRVAWSYVSRNHDALGLTQADLTTFVLRRDYVDVSGTHHLSWNQRIGGLKVFSNGLTAAVDDTGRLLTVGGSPVTGATAPATAVRPPAGPRGSAEPVLFVTRSRSYRAWQSITASGPTPAVSVYDLASGRLLYRRSLVADATRSESAGGTPHPYFPGHAIGGAQVTVDFGAPGWLGPAAQVLFGNNTHTWSDVDDDDQAQASEEVRPRAGSQWDYPFKPVTVPEVSFCGAPYPCSWDPNTPYSWRKNRAQNATQVFYFVNTFHDHLLARPIGFTEAAGNFQLTNSTRRGVAGDPVLAQTDDGADTADGLPDNNHVDNATMSTPPDGTSPRMQLYLQHLPGTTYPEGDSVSPTNAGDEADTVYHEYTHGLSNRLVVDADGLSTLGEVQAGAMGEAWGDWYAMDYLVGEGLQADTKKADVVLFQYHGVGAAAFRTEPIDCKVSSASPLCAGGATGHTGGYTYADYGRVAGGPDVHADGEIWAQTLWSLRAKVGAAAAETLVTRAMELAPGNPSYLDMRNAILVADTAAFAGEFHTKLWQVFASRGLGFHAGSLGGDDTTPGASTDVPPAEVATGTLTGTVTDAATGLPVKGVSVTLAFQGGGTVTNPTVVTDAAGQYRLQPAPLGTYSKLVVGGGGYEPARKSATVTGTGSSVSFALRRSWTTAGSGATIAGFSGPDLGPLCGPAQAVDGSVLRGWQTTSGNNLGAPTNAFVPKYVVIDLGIPVDVTDFGVDPSATCGDAASAATGAYRIETSPDGTTWTLAVTGTFDDSHRGRVNLVRPRAGKQGVRYVRFTILGNQTPAFTTSCPDGPFAGCAHADLTEFKVYGAAAG